MMKKLGMLSAFATLFSLTPMQAQTSTCSLSDSESGTDNSGVTATVTDFSCIDTVTNSFVMGVTVDAAIGGTWSSNCPSWYDFELKVNGNSVANNLCSGTYNLAEYVNDLNNITSISVVSEDNDGWGDGITMDLDVDLSYIITTCPPPSALAVNGITSSTAWFSWTPNGSELLWDIELVDITAGDTATGTPTTFGAIADSVELTSLAADNMYEVYVRANCATGTDTESIWMGPIAFTTEPTCYPVSNVQIADVIDVSATASWGSNETEWEIELVDITGGGTFAGVPTVLSLTDSTYDFTGLTPDNVYSFKVRANCGPLDGNSVWSAAVNFTTDPSCMAPTDITMTSLSDSSVTISWTSNDDESTWGIELINIDNGEVADLTSDYTSADTTYEITGLDANTTYQIFVNAECSATDHSDWTSMAEFTTLCTSASIPYIDSLNYWPTDCYTLSNSGTSSNWQVYTGSTGVIEANFWNFSSGSVTFETGKITISEQAKLEFVWSSGLSTFYDDQMIISYSNDGGVTWTEMWNKIGSQLASNDGASSTSPGSFITTEILIPDTEVGNDLIFQFHGITDWGPDFFLDEIRVVPLPDCNPAYNVAVDTVTATDATFSFQDIVGDNSVSWDYVVTSYSDTITGNATATPFTVTGLTPGVNYNIQIMTLCTTDSTDLTAPLPFQTECSPVAYYTQGFETYGSGDLPLCWEELEVATSTFADVEVNTFNGYNSSNGLQFYNSSSSSPSSTHLIALTPELLDVSDNWLKLRHKTNSTGNQKLVFGYMTDITDEDTFEPLDTVDLTQNVWEEYTFIPSDYASFTEDRIAIKALFDGTYKYSYIDEVIWEPIPDCYYPNDVTIDSTTLDAVYASIDPYNPTDAVWEIELVNLTNGETFTGTPSDTVTTSIFFIDGLQNSSEYAMYIRTNCGTETSIWGSPYFFATQCAAVTDFIQDFEVGTNCWTLNDIATSTSAQNNVVTFTANSGSQANYLYNSFSNDPNQTFIATVTPELANIAAGTHWIKFQARRRYSWSSTGNLELGTMSDPTDPSTYTQLTTFNLTNSYQEYHYSFVSYTGTDSYIAIRLLIDGSYRYVMVDDVVWEPVPECATPENVDGVEILDVTAEIDWNPISIDSAWSMEIVDITNGGSATGVATDSTTSHPYTFTGLTQNTTYAVYVQADCDTNWSVPYLFTTLISHDIEVTNFVSPISNGCMLTTNEEVIVTLTNNGAQDATGFDVSYSFDGVNYTSDGIFTGTLAANTDTAYTLSTTFDFTSATDTNLFVAVDLPTDTIMVANDTNSTFITNLGDQLMQLEVTSGQYAGEHVWFVIDTLSGTTVAAHTSSNPVGGEYQNYTTYLHDVCVFVGNTYSMEAWDSYGDGWNGGTYQLMQCGGVLVANNGGLSPTTPPNSFQSGGQLESQEYFTVEECDDYDLGIISMDSIYSSCDMTATEQGYLLVQNYGLMDITAANSVSVEYQVNGSGWSNLVTFSNFASGADTLLALPTVDMTTPLTYTFEFQVVYALDENANNDTLVLDIESVDTYDEVDQDFDDAPSGWTAHISANSSLSWEWGVPTTPLISNGVTGSAWVTNLDENMFLNEESYLLSPCFDFSGYTEDAEVAFDFIWTTPTSSNRVNFQVSTDGGATWPPIFGASWDNVTMPVNTTTWTHYISLMDLAGEGDVKFRFFMDNSFSTDAEGFGLDNFQVFEHVPYTDTTLMDLTVDNVTIPGFDPAVFDYTYELPYGTTVVPIVGATVNAPFYESMVINQSPTVPGTATVVVTAEDTNFTGTYTINFTEAPASTNAYLSDLQLDGVTITGFDSLTFIYNVTLLYGSNQPLVGYTLADGTATGDLTSTGTVPGSVTIVVTAQDGVTTNTYVINFDEEPADTVSTLSDLTVNTNTVAGFDPDTLNYVEVATFPATVGYIPTTSTSSVTVSPVGPYTTATLVTITVTAQDGSITTYTVDLIDPLSDDADLSDLTYDDGSGDVTVSGFHPDTVEYTIEIPYGSPIPDVDYTTSDVDATVDVVTSGFTTTVTVTAADGSTKTYTINWDEADPSTNNLLASLTFGSGTFGELYIGGYGAAYGAIGFDPNENDYRFYVSSLIDASIIHPVNAVAQDPTAIVTVTNMPTLYSDVAHFYQIDVTAQNGDVNTYYIWPINGVGQNELDAGTVSMYPNPSTGIVNVEVKEDISDYTVEVVSATGQRVFFSEYTNDNAQVILDLSSVADGMYYVTVKDSKSGKYIREKISIIK
jgi:hypothetical protein